METFFTSDTHFWHKNILSFTDRPYSDVREMNEKMIEKWNEQVSNRDLVYHLGDLSFGSYDQTVECLKRLNGKIVLIKGNHDFDKYYKRIYKEGYLKEYHKLGEYIKYKKFQMYLCHYPIEIGVRPRLFSIHGHLHDEVNPTLNQINVGVDSPEFEGEFGRLVMLEELYEKMCDINEILVEKYNKKG